MTVKRIIYSIILVGFALLFITYLKLSSDTIPPHNCIIHTDTDIDAINFRNFDSVTLSATYAYKGDLLKNVLQGNNYRRSWEAKIKAPIIYLDTLYGSVEIVKEGGGKQTNSLRLRTKDSLLLALRSVNKNPNTLVPDYLKNLGLENIVMDGISGQHPYAALVVSNLAEAINIMHTYPRVVFLPKQESMSSYFNGKYGNKLYLLEYENKGHFNWTRYNEVFKIVDTDNLQKLKGERQHRLLIDKRKLIRARLFDIVIGDWDRHAKQWGWVVIKNNHNYKAIPLPTDRDNAFFNVDGIVNQLISNESITPHLRSFETDVNYIEGLVYDFDVYFLQNTTLDEFIAEARYIKTHLTNQSIERAFRAWNKEIYDLDAKSIAEKIKSRRDKLEEIARRFKQALDKKPLLNKPLKGSDSNDTKGTAIQCFEC